MLEIIPAPSTDAEVIQFLLHYGDLYLGKTTVLCKDTPAFIANRIGVWAMMKTLEVMQRLGLTVDEIDALTGPILGRPKSATFRTLDMAGLDVLANVVVGLHQALKGKERDVLQLPDFMKKMLQNNWLGDKTGQGFYKKIKTEKGSEILTLDLHTQEYVPQKTFGLKGKDLKELLVHEKYGAFYRETLGGLFSYASHCIPEISDEIYRLDEAMRSGFGWEKGPFEMWDDMGVKKTLPFVDAAPWVIKMAEAGKNFYEKGKCYDPVSQRHKSIPHDILILRQAEHIVWEKAGSKALDLGDDILHFSWTSPGHTIGQSVREGLHQALDLAEENFAGLVIGHNGADFSFGADLSLVLALIEAGDFEMLDAKIREFQEGMMRLRYASVPVVVCPRGRTLGGGCEMTMHAQAQAAAESYIGLVEAGVGLIPAGGGTKEMARRLSLRKREGDAEMNVLQQAYLNIATGKVSTSACEARQMGFLRPQDGISINKNRQLTDAKNKAIALAKQGYSRPLPEKIMVQGRTGIALFEAGIAGLKAGNFISRHDAAIASKIAYVLCGGDLSYPQETSEQYLLDLEREAFLSLGGEKKTEARIRSVLTNGKPLRN
ncbi:MAG: 3-hydroxyacyl-CoA dehydrogenase [Candidatus Nephrothrix sp. EaCA]|nr:MAG: 3-hydroxyacyl-CoA dehydrogenase [Candidatus Nephrothrix sp. EaCA]